MMRLVAVFVAAAALTFAPVVMAIEEAPFSVVESQDRFQLREYQPYAVAETVVEGSFETAGNEGFRRLVRYIGGANQGKREISMTAPVEQTEAGEKIAMTAPVEQRAEGNRWRIGFVLPAEYTAENAPVPDDRSIEVRTVPGRLMASVRYSGRWTRANYDENLAALRAWVAQKGWTVAGEPLWARYNPPMLPWFLRRNEILLPVKRP